MSRMSDIFNFGAQQDVVQMLPGITRKALAYSETMIACELRMEKGSVVPLHQHVHEQCSMVISGKLRYTVCIHAVVNFIGSVPSLLLLKLGADEKLTWFGELLGAGDAEALVDFLADNWLIIALYLFYSFVLLTVVLVGIALGIAFFKRVIRGADGLAHMFVTTSETATGCGALAHLVSENGNDWRETG